MVRSSRNYVCEGGCKQITAIAAACPYKCAAQMIVMSVMFDWSYPITAYSQQSDRNHTVIEASRSHSACRLCLGDCSSAFFTLHVLVCPSQIGFLSKLLDGANWFFSWSLLSTYPTLCYKVSSIFRNKGPCLWSLDRDMWYTGIRKISRY